MDGDATWGLEHRGKSFTPTEWRYPSRASLHDSFAAAIGTHSFGNRSASRLGLLLSRVVPAGSSKRVAQPPIAAAVGRCDEAPDQATCKPFRMHNWGRQADPWV